MNEALLKALLSICAVLGALMIIIFFLVAIVFAIRLIKELIDL